MALIVILPMPMLLYVLPCAAAAAAMVVVVVVVLLISTVLFNLYCLPLKPCFQEQVFLIHHHKGDEVLLVAATLVAGGGRGCAGAAGGRARAGPQLDGLPRVRQPEVDATRRALAGGAPWTAARRGPLARLWCDAELLAQQKLAGNLGMHILVGLYSGR